MPENTSDENKLLSPAQAVDFLRKHRNAEDMTVDILRQMRRKGRIKGIAIGADVGESRITLYDPKDLMEADISQHKAGRPKAQKE